MAKAKTIYDQPVDDYIEKLASAAETTSPAWLETEYTGQLAVDVYQTDKDIVIRAAIAGVQAEDIDIAVNDDVVTIKGLRQVNDDVTNDAFLYQECYWGGFSRTIILPVEVDGDHVSASLKNGILRVILPKSKAAPTKPIVVHDEEAA